MLLTTSGVLGKAIKLSDKALHLEKEIGLEVIYNLISNGVGLSEISDSLGVSDKDLRYILTRTKDHRRQYMSATIYSRALKSGEILNTCFSKETQLDKYQQNAANHHTKMVDTSLRVMELDKEVANSSIVVQNTIVVKSANDIPELPPGLSDAISNVEDEILEGEYEDVSVDS